MPEPDNDAEKQGKPLAERLPNLCRILGLIGTVTALLALIYAVAFQVKGAHISMWFFVGGLVFSLFHLVPLPRTKGFRSSWHDSLLGLWIRARKSKLRKQIDE